MVPVRKIGSGLRGLAASWLLALAMLATSIATLQPAIAAPAAASLDVLAPSSAEVGKPLVLTFAVRGAADLAGYEAEVDYDTQAADFDGLHQRRNDLRTL